MFNFRLLALGIVVLALATVVGAAAFLQGLGAATRAAGAGEKPLQGIVVGGEGIVYAEPDMAVVQLGVQTTALTAQEAQQKNAELMGKVVDQLLALKIDRKDIRTSGISLHPVFETRSGNSSRPTGYQASNQVSVTVRDLKKASSVLDTAVAAGANTAGGISFGFQDDRRLRQEALAKAVEDAKAKAEAIAKAAGLRITGVQSVVENGAISPGPIDALRAMPAPSAQADTPVMPGQLTIVARVQVSYSY